jgi:hypothetical protein
MQPLRLLVVATAMIGLLALVAGFAATDDRLRDDTETQTNAVVPPAVSDRTVEAKVPRTKPIVARVGETVQLTVTLKADDTVLLDAFGVEEDIAAGVPTSVLIPAVSPGRYDLKLEGSGKRIGQLVVRAAEDAPSGGGTEPEPDLEEQAPSLTDPATV